MKKLSTVVLVFFLIHSGIAFGETVLTIYSDGLGLVRKTATYELKRGIQIITTADLPRFIEPESLEFILDRNLASVIEQSFYPQRTDPSYILNKYVGKKITVRLKSGELVEGILQSVQGPVIQTPGGFTVINADAVERYELPQIPSVPRASSEAVWTIESRANTKARGTQSYLTKGFDWKALYTAVLSERDRKMEITSRVSLSNNTGSSYTDAGLKLVAGNIHRAVSPPDRPMPMRSMLDAQAAIPESFEQRAFSEYYLYDLNRFINIADGEQKQIKLYDSANVDVNLRYVFDHTVNPERVTRSAIFVNSEKQGLGRPLPEGIMKVYVRDRDGSLELAGEDRIRHTPRDEEVTVTLGTAFDITAERRVAEMDRVTQRIREQRIEIDLRNRKDEDVEIIIVERLWGVWEILKSSHSYTKKDATTVEFTVKVPARGEATVTYTARFQ